MAKKTKSEISEELRRRLEDALDRQISGIQANTKLASSATYGDPADYREILSWLKNAQNCLNEAVSIASELGGKADKRPEDF